MQQQKTKIIETIVVEGKTDSDKLKSIFDVNTIETHGTSLNNKVKQEIISVAKQNGIILFLDPDFTGEKIRRKIMEFLPDAKHCFLKQSDMHKNSKKIGIAEATNEAIIKAIENVCTFKTNDSLSWNDYIDLDLDTKQKRKLLCEYLKISECNHKQLFKRLNMLNKNKAELLKIISELF